VTVTLSLPGTLQELADGRASLSLEGPHATVAHALAELRSTWPAVYERIMTETGEVRPHINLFVDDLEIRRSGGLATTLESGGEIYVLPSVSGG